MNLLIGPIVGVSVGLEYVEVEDAIVFDFFLLRIIWFLSPEEPQ